MDALFLEDFRRTLDNARRRLLEQSDPDAGRPRAAGKWSPKQIVGHLIDSAANNHARFTRAQSTDDLLFEGYDQETWVQVQAYDKRPWADLIQLWYAYNRHLADVMESTAHDALHRARRSHSLDRIAWRPLDPETPATLDYMMRDYVGHLKHHLGQILNVEI